jgi:hypothetical protein
MKVSIGHRRPKGNVGMLVLVVVSVSVSWSMSSPMSDRDVAAEVDDILMSKWRQIKKQSGYCVDAAGKCFSTGQCCRGLVCAAFDDYFGQKPEVPGLCVKEKDLQVCATNSDCEGGSKCASLGRTGERYCLPRSEDGANKNGLLKQAIIDKVLGGLGSECRSDSDCKTTTEVDNHQLCCQDVRRGRQGIRRVCDRKTAISQCISE